VTDLLTAAAAGLWMLAMVKGLKLINVRRARTKALSKLGVAAAKREGKPERSPLLSGLAGRLEGSRLSRLAAERHPAMLFSDYLALLLIGAIGGGIAGSILFGWGMTTALAIFLGPPAADRVAMQLASRRSLKLEQQLPEALSLQAAALRAGRSTPGSLRSVAADVTGKLKEELERVIREVDLGGSIEQSLDALVKRSRSKDVEIWVTAMLVHRQTGGNLATVIDSLSERVRERAHMRAELRALTAQGRLSGIVIAVAPIAFFFVLSVTAKEQMQLIYSTPLGLTLLVVGLSMEALGFLWISRILKVKS
jgi:tight adherence protein B